jgi:hypothetical protein
MRRDLEDADLLAGGGGAELSGQNDVALRLASR